ncbi:MAG: putative geopeptide radical SAM maturase [Desulfobacterales bacterium]|nr:putative geopeptide radical SAM maturase [Desulfobacterales bacterium]
MQLSQYVKIFPHDDGRLILFSTRKASVVIVSEDILRSIEEDDLSPENEKQLLDLAFITPDRDAEKQDVMNFFDRVNERNIGLRATAVLNMDCNFACTYCYQGDLKGDLYMSERTAGQFVDFIKKRFSSRKKKLLIDFYGGEPLLSYDLIKTISRELKPFAESREASYESTLVSNGSLFTRKRAKELAELGLSSIKITLDGPPEIHDRNRPFKNGKGSFQTLINNIKNTHDIVKIGIGGNYTEENYKHFVSLLDCLEKEGLTPDKLGIVKFSPVMKPLEGYDTVSDCGAGCLSVTEPWIVEVEKLLRKEILRRGYATPKPSPILCLVENRDSHVVNYDGLIYKCPGFLGIKEWAIGDLETGVKEYDDVYKIGVYKNEECGDCVYLPLCFGGCRYMTFLRNGAITGIDCGKTYLDASLEIAVKQDIKYRK